MALRPAAARSACARFCTPLDREQAEFRGKVVLVRARWPKPDAKPLPIVVGGEHRGCAQAGPPRSATAGTACATAESVVPLIAKLRDCAAGRRARAPAVRSPSDPSAREPRSRRCWRASPTPASPASCRCRGRAPAAMDALAPRRRSLSAAGGRLPTFGPPPPAAFTATHQRPGRGLAALAHGAHRRQRPATESRKLPDAGMRRSPRAACERAAAGAKPAPFSALARGRQAERPRYRLTEQNSPDASAASDDVPVPSCVIGTVSELRRPCRPAAVGLSARRPARMRRPRSCCPRCTCRRHRSAAAPCCRQSCSAQSRRREGGLRGDRFTLPHWVGLERVHHHARAERRQSGSVRRSSWRVLARAPCRRRGARPAIRAVAVSAGLAAVQAVRPVPRPSCSRADRCLPLAQRRRAARHPSRQASRGVAGQDPGDRRKAAGVEATLAEVAELRVRRIAHVAAERRTGGGS